VTIQIQTESETAVQFAAVYARVQQFYARHMQLLDAGEAETWAADFTEDATFSVPTLPEPVRGRAALAATVRCSADTLRELGEQQRHWPGVFDVAPGPDGEVIVRSYTVVYASPAGGESRVHRVCACTDVLVPVDGELKVRERRVTRDDLR